MDTRNPSTYLPFSQNAPGGKRINHVESANRKLIRPSLTEYKEQQQQQQQLKQQELLRQQEQLKQQQEQQHQHAAFVHKQQLMKQKRPVPPEQTNAENFYYVKQMQSRTPMVVVLHDGEELHGVIEWYDRACIKVNRPQGPNVLVYKANIKYLYKESDKNGSGSEGEAG